MQLKGTVDKQAQHHYSNARPVSCSGALHLTHWCRTSMSCICQGPDQNPAQF